MHPQSTRPPVSSIICPSFGETRIITTTFFQELKRRNVARVAVLYIIASWLILQVADVGVSLLGLPEWIGKAIFLLLALGFPLALIFSWVYEMTPEGLKKEKDIDRSQSITPATGHKINVLIIVLLILAIGTVVLDRLMPQSTPVVEMTAIEEGEETAAADPATLAAAKFAPAADRSIAVLPFVNMSSDPEQEYFSDGLSEELLNLLAKVPELQVTSRSSAFAFKGEKIDIPEVAQKLNVAHVLEGSVRKSGNQVRVTAQLIDASTDTHMWSETFDRTLDNIFAIQDEIAAEVVAQLKVTLLGATPKVRQTDPEAYTLALQAQHLDRQGTVEAWKQAMVLYQKALGIAPDYAPAWAGLAQVYSGLASQGEGELTMEQGLARAREAANKAVALDPDYAPAHDAAGAIAMTVDRDLAAAAAHYELALALDPGNSDILGNAAVLARALGRPDEGIELLQYAVERDPINPTHHFYLGVVYSYAGRLDEAIASLRTALALSPARIAVQANLGDVLLRKGKPEEALAAIQQEPSLWREIYLPVAYWGLGRKAESDAALAELIENQERDAAYNIAYVYAYRGEADRAFEWLDKAVAYKDPGLTDIALEPLFANIRDDPRWLPFLERAGKAPQQLAAIKFEVKLPD